VIPVSPHVRITSYACSAHWASSLHASLAPLTGPLHFIQHLHHASPASRITYIKGEVFPASEFHLGNWGYFIDAFAIGFLALAFVFLFFPAVPNPLPMDMNWGILTYGVAVLFASGHYLVKGKA
jgi:hypothetical protein